MPSFKEALKNEHPLQIIGVPNAYVALMAQETGFKALYLSGASVANFCYGLPDLELTTLTEIAEEARRITTAVDLPLLVDIDTGWGDALMINRVTDVLIRAGVAALQIEDQSLGKRCGHREGKKLVSTDEMRNRITSIIEAKKDRELMVVARTDALASEGIEQTIQRAAAYEAAGADAIFAEAFTEIEQYKQLREAIHIPILANLTEFGKTPLLDLNQLDQAGVSMALYPLSVARAMNRTASEVLDIIRSAGTQKEIINRMQTRDELYDVLNYESHEQARNRS